MCDTRIDGWIKQQADAGAQALLDDIVSDRLFSKLTDEKIRMFARTRMKYLAQACFDRLRLENLDLRVLLCDVAQLLDGWHTDVAWTEWDESVRRRVSDLMSELQEAYDYERDSDMPQAAG